MLADGVQLDPGAIGKGLAADLVAEDLLGRGAVAATVDVGGDVRVTARSVIGVNGPDRRPLDRIALASGGVATSGTSRRWIAADGSVGAPRPRSGVPTAARADRRRRPGAGDGRGRVGGRCRGPRDRRPRRSQRAEDPGARSAGRGRPRRGSTRRRIARTRRGAGSGDPSAPSEEQPDERAVRVVPRQVERDRVARVGRLRAGARAAALDPCAQAARPTGMAPGDAPLGEHPVGRGYRRSRAGARRRQLRAPSAGSRSSCR